MYLQWFLPKNKEKKFSFDLTTLLAHSALERRRDQMCLKFAKQCLKIDKMKKFFGKNYTEHSMMKRDFNAFKVVRV